MDLSLDALIARAEAWLIQDPDPDNAREVRELIAARDQDGLTQRFSAELVFGTAGLRGFIGAGPNRMNRVTVGRASAGLAVQLAATVANAHDRGVVVGRDARHKSLALAIQTAETLVGAGFKVHWVPEPAPTPIVAFAGRYLNAAAAVVVTASHNPPQYNGFKVYSERGSQIVPPQDREILSASRDAPPFKRLPKVDFETALAGGSIQELAPAVEEAYYAALDGQCMLSVPPPAALRVVTTSLHGVGNRPLLKALARRGFEDVTPVAAQADPDPNFSTVTFPNPEEDGALDLALALARSEGADILIANDPDADRLCVAVASGDGHRPLTGNELGALLGDWLLGEAARRGTLPNASVVITTVVSSQLLGKIATSYGVRSEATLTGFKWIWDRAIALAEEGVEFRFGYEEALGYCVGQAVRDKDGISAAQVVCELAAQLKAEGKSLLDALDALWCRYGFHASGQVATTFPGLAGKAQIDALMERLRQQPPAEVLDTSILRIVDLLEDGSGLPRSNVLIWEMSDGARLVFRPSGTEPKLKAYVEVCVAVERGDTQAARESGLARLAQIEDWIKDTIDRTS